MDQVAAVANAGALEALCGVLTCRDSQVIRRKRGGGDPGTCCKMGTMKERLQMKEYTQ